MEPFTFVKDKNENNNSEDFQVLFLCSGVLAKLSLACLVSAMDLQWSTTDHQQQQPRRLATQCSGLGTVTSLIMVKAEKMT